MARLPLILLPLIAGCTQATLSFGTDDTPGADTPTDSDRADEQRDLPGAATFEPADDSEDDAVAAFRSALRGDFGEMGQFADDLSDVETTIGPTFSSVTLHTLGDHGWAMLRLELDGQLGHGRLRPGETVYLSGFGIEPADDAVIVDGSAQGCTGPDMWDFDDDLFTDEVVIGLSQHPQTGVLVMDIQADFSDGSHMVGSATIE